MIRGRRRQDKTGLRVQCEESRQGIEVGRQSRHKTLIREWLLSQDLFPPSHTQTHNTAAHSTVPLLASLEVGLALTHVAGCSCLFHPGTFLSVSARRGSVCQRELAGTGGGIWWATPAHWLPYCNRGLWRPAIPWCLPLYVCVCVLKRGATVYLGPCYLCSHFCSSQTTFTVFLFSLEQNGTLTLLFCLSSLICVSLRIPWAVCIVQ